MFILRGIYMTGFSTTKSVLIYSFGCKQGSVHAFFSIDKLHFLYLWKFFPKNFHLTRDCFAMATRWQEPLKQSAWRHKPYYSGFSRAVPQYSWCSRRTLLKISLGVDYSFINRTQNLFLCFMVYNNRTVDIASICPFCIHFALNHHHQIIHTARRVKRNFLENTKWISTPIATRVNCWLGVHSFLKGA